MSARRRARPFAQLQPEPTLAKTASDPLTTSSARTAAFGLLALILLPACAHLAPSLTACRSDADCKLDRICEAERCVWPPNRRAGPAKAISAPATPAPNDKPNVPPVSPA